MSNQSPEGLADSLEIARLFHETYERLAPKFGYRTRPDTKKFDPHSPNGRLMIATCDRILTALRDHTGAGDALLYDLRHWISHAHYNAIGARDLLARLDNHLSRTPDREPFDRKAVLESAWRDGWAECKGRLTEDEAFCLTADVEEDAWVDSKTARALLPPAPPADTPSE